MNFDFYLPTKIISGENCALSNSLEFKSLGDRALIVTGKNSAKSSGALDDVTKALDNQGIKYTVFDEIGANPLLADCIKGGEIGREFSADFVVGIGGGSPLDAAKAIAVLVSNKDLVGESVIGAPFKNRLKIALVGTSAGTGSEANNYSILTLKSGKKVTLSSKNLYPEVSFCDYRYTKTLSDVQTLSTGLDCVAHLIGGYFSKSSSDLSDIIALEGLKLSKTGFEKIKELGIEIAKDEVRESLYQASVYGGIVINKSGTLFCHPLGYFTTEEYDYPHGFACNLFHKELVDWCEKNNKEKMDRLLFALGYKEASELIDVFSGYTSFNEKISKRKLEEVVLEKLETNNFKNTPGNFTKEEALGVMDRVFLKI